MFKGRQRGAAELCILGERTFTWVSELQNKNSRNPGTMLTRAYDVPTPYGELALFPLCRSRWGSGAGCAGRGEGGGERAGS